MREDNIYSKLADLGSYNLITGIQKLLCVFTGISRHQPSVIFYQHITLIQLDIFLNINSFSNLNRR